MIKFDLPPLFQPRVEKKFRPPTSSLNPPPKEKFQPPTSFWTIRTLGLRTVARGTQGIKIRPSSRTPINLNKFTDFDFKSIFFRLSTSRQVQMSNDSILLDVV